MPASGESSRQSTSRLLRNLRADARRLTHALGPMTENRATIIATADDPAGREAAWAWLQEHRPSLSFVLDNLGCGCCVDMWDVESRPEVVASIPSSVRAVVSAPHRCNPSGSYRGATGLWGRHSPPCRGAGRARGARKHEARMLFIAAFNRDLPRSASVA